MKKKLFIVFVLLAMSQHIYAQIIGTASVTQSDTDYYNIIDSYISITWSVWYGGVITNDYGYGVDVHWTDSGSGLVYVEWYDSFGYHDATLHVSITQLPPPPPPITTPSINASCSDAILTMNHANRPSGVNWFWQGTSPNGTNKSTSVNTNSSYTVSSATGGPDTYFVRAHDGYNWSASNLSFSVAYLPTPTTPSANNVTYCGSVVALSTSVVGMAEYEWFDQNDVPLGTTTANGMPYGTAGLTSYKVRVKNGSGCWSAISSPATLTYVGIDVSGMQISGDLYYCDSNGVNITLTNSIGFSIIDQNTEFRLYKNGSTTPHTTKPASLSDNNTTMSFGPYTPGTSDSYTIGVIEPGCDEISLTGISTITKLVLSAVPTSPTICPGENFSIVTSDPQSELYAAATGGSPMAITRDEKTIISSAGPGTYYVGLPIGECTSKPREMVTFTLQPDVTLVSGPSGDLTPCQSSTVTYTADADYENAYSWSVVPTWAGNFSNPAVGQIAWSSSFTGNATIHVTATGQCGQPVTDDIPVTVIPYVGQVAFIGPPTGVCMETATTDFNATASDEDSYTWSLSTSGAGTISSSGLLTWNSTYTGQVRVTVQANGCGTPTTAYIDVIRGVYITSGISSRCIGSGSNDYNAQSAFPDQTITWSLTPLTPASAGSINSSSGLISWNSTFTGYAYVKATASGGSCGIPPEYTRSVYVRPNTGQVVITAGITERCQGSGNDDYDASAPYVDGTSTYYDWYLEPELAGSISSSGDVTWDPDFSGSAQVKVVAQRCGPATEDSLSVMVHPLPVIDAGPDQRMFSGDIATLSPTPTNGIWSTASAGLSGNSFAASLASTGLHTLTFGYTDTNNSCSALDVLLISVESSPSVLLSEETNTLTATPGYTQYQWRNNSTNITDANNDSYIALADGLYSVEITTYSGHSWITNETLITIPVEPSDENYVMTRVYKEAGLDENSNIDNPYKVSKKMEYLDGLGRPMQTVISRGSPTRSDIILPFDYDEYGRMTTEYLPYAAGSGGVYQSGAIGDELTYTSSPQYNFYQTTEKVASDQAPYRKRIYEGSPLNRVLKQGAPGSAWQPDQNSAVATDRIIRFDYTSNGPTEVLLWTLDAFDLPTTNTHYASNELYQTITEDEEFHQVIEYTDKQGRTISKKVQTDDISNPWAQTYYVYDDFNNLKYVLPPMVFEGNEILDAEELEDFCFHYKYDHRKRMVEKKVPGNGWLYLVYDKRDRLVLTQDTVQRADNEWIFTKYDMLNRPVSSGLYTNSTEITRTSVQNLVDTQVGGSRLWYENKTTQSGNVHGYTNAAFPDVIDSTQYLSVTYYDNYDFLNGSEWGSGIYDFEDQGEQVPAVTTDGTSEYIALNHYYTDPVANITVEAWVKTSYVNQNGVDKSNYSIISYDRNEYFNLYVGGANGKVSFETMASSRHNLISTVAVNDGQWHHIAAVYDGTDKVIYIDGVENARTDNAHGGQDLGDGTTRYGIIGDASQASDYNGNRDNRYFKGTMREIRLWETTRTAQQISDHKDQSLTGTEPGLEAYWDFTAGSGTIVNDKTGNGHTGTMYNMDNSNWVAGLIAGTTLANPFYTVKGRATGGKTKNLANGAWLKSASYYDDRYRIIQALRDNNLGGKDRISNFHDFTGKALKNITVHSNSINTTTITRKFEYDHADRLLTVRHQVDDHSEVILLQNEYNELGELIDKKLYSTDGIDFMQSVDYRYNIRGWLRSMNNSELVVNSDNDEDTDFFGFELAYNDAMSGVSNTPAYNGNISAMTWSDFAKTNQADRRAYSYTYDPMNRIKAAQHYDNAAGTLISTSSYSVSGIGYDLNGNIESLQRKGIDGSNLDNLSYTYVNGNRLDQVEDAFDDDLGFKDGISQAAEYTYDSNGNMITDANKGITDIDYNHLNLPIKVDMGSNNWIAYEYDAAGIKLRQTVYEDSLETKITDYVGEFIYETRPQQDSVRRLQFIQHEEGRIVSDHDDKMTYQYHLKDHLGNTRASFTTGKYNSGYLATLEDVNIEQESEEFYNLNNIVPYPVGGKAVRLNSSYPIGPGICLSVSAADTISMSVKAYYEGVTGHGTSNLAAADMVDALTLAFGGITGAGASEAQQTIYDIFNNDPAVTGALLSGGNSQDTIPSGYLNYMLFDQEFNYIDAGYFGIGSGANLEQTISVDSLVIGQAGIIFIYVSNESNSTQGLYFDNLDVAVSESPVLETTDYYPFGLTFGNGSGVWSSTEITTVVDTLVDVDFSSTNHGFERISGIMNVTGGQKLRLRSNSSNNIGKVRRTITTQQGISIKVSYDYSKILGDVDVFVDGVLYETLTGSGLKQISITGTGSDVDIEFHLTTYNYGGYTKFLLDNFVVIETIEVVATGGETSAGPLAYFKPGMIAQNFKYNGKEEINDLDFNVLDYGARFFDPAIARFTTIDPLAKKYNSHSPYHYALNNPIRYKDYLGMGAQEKGKKGPCGDNPCPDQKSDNVSTGARAAQGAATSAAATTVQSAKVRDAYKKTVSSLDPSDSKGRTKAKVDARSKTPAVTKTVAENMRPIAKESSRAGGTASKTNVKVNNTVKNLAKGGKVLGSASVVFSAYNIATAEDKSRAIASETGALAGAIAGGEGGAIAGAAIGVWFGGAGAVPGAIIGGVIGSIGGAITGSFVAEEVHDAVETAITN